MQEEVILNKIEANNAKLDDIGEKQDIISDSLQNKYNQLSNTMGKIHQNVKSNNHKYTNLMNNINDMKALLEQGYSEELENKVQVLMEQIDKKDESETPVESNITCDKEVRHVDYKLFMNKWFNKNLKITKNPHYVVDMEEIKTKLEKYLLKEDVDLDKNILYDRLESYLKYWYNNHSKNICFDDIINESINNNRLYSYLKFININEERENRIKNSVIAWLKEHTCEVEGCKTYTEDILKNIQPIFEDNGWIITSPIEYGQLQQAGFTKVCVKRTFSQIIGKAVQELYNHITTDTIQRDTPGNGYVTWYPNIKIIDRKLSDSVQVTIKDELSNDIFDGDNLVCKWLYENLSFTGNDDDRVCHEVLLDNLRKLLKKEDALISEETLQRLYRGMLDKLSEHYNVEYSMDDDFISCFRLVSSSDIEDILSDWLSDHLEVTDNVGDIVPVGLLDEKLLTALYKKNYNIVKDDVYQQLPEALKNTFIKESQYKSTLNTILKQKISGYDEENSIIQSARIIEYKSLTRKQVTQWVNTNINELLKNNVSNKKQIIKKFKQHLQETNTKNNTPHTIEQLLDEEIRNHYTEQHTTLKLLNDSQEEYYVIIT